MCLILSNTSQCVVYRMKDLRQMQLYGSASFQQPWFEPFLWDHRVENMFPSTPLILWQFCFELSFSTMTMPYTWRFLEVTILRKIRHAPRLIKRIQNIHPRIIGDSQMTVWKKYVSEVIFIGRERKLKNEENGTQENMLFFVTQYHQDLAKPKTIPTHFLFCFFTSRRLASKYGIVWRLIPFFKVAVLLQPPTTILPGFIR